MSETADHACEICGVFGAWGTRIRRDDWRHGYRWRCAEHRMVVRPTEAQPQSATPVKPSFDAKGQGRML